MAPEVAGFHPTALGKWEKGDGHRSPNPEQLQVWALVLGFELLLMPKAA